jgi:hypothetical protein
MSGCTRLTVSLLLAGFVVFSIIPSCSDPTEPEQDKDEIVNDDKPTANSRILLQKTLGDAGKWSSLWEIAADNSGGFFYRGGMNSYRGAGRMNAEGDAAWHTRTTFSARDIVTTAPTAVVPNSPIFSGAHDTDGDGSDDTAYLSLLSPAGTLLSQLVYSADTAGVWLNAIVPLSDSTFITVGGAKTATTTYPLVVAFKLVSSGDLEKRTEIVLNGLPGHYFAYAVRDPEEDTSTGVTLFVNSGPDAAAVHQLDIALPDLDPVTVEWTREIVFTTAEDPTIGDLRFFEDNLYVVGHADDTTKEPPSGGGFWDSGFAASLTLAGDIRWSRVVRLTGHSENLYAVVPTSDALYAVGSAGAYEHSDQRLGYGWISKIATTTGDVVANLTFGNEKYQSAFNDGIITGDVIRCGGWTRQETSAANYLAWFCAISVSGL